MVFCRLASLSTLRGLCRVPAKAQALTTRATHAVTYWALTRPAHCAYTLPCRSFCTGDHSFTSSESSKTVSTTSEPHSAAYITSDEEDEVSDISSETHGETSDEDSLADLPLPSARDCNQSHAQAQKELLV